MISLTDNRQSLVTKIRSNPLRFALAIAIFGFMLRGDLYLNENQFAVFVIFTSCICFLIGYRGTFLGLSSLNWAVTRGKVTKSGVRNFVAHGSDRTIYGLELEYQFVIEESFYSGTIYSHKHTLNQANRAQIENVSKNFPVGAELDIYYDPKDPNKSVLIRGINSWTWCI